MWGPCLGVDLPIIFVFCFLLHLALNIPNEFDSLIEHCELPSVPHGTRKSRMVVLMAHYRRSITSLLNLDQQFCHCLDSRTGLDGIMNYLQLWNVVTRFTRSGKWSSCAVQCMPFSDIFASLQVGYPVCLWDWVELCLKI